MGGLRSEVVVGVSNHRGDLKAHKTFQSGWYLLGVESALGSVPSVVSCFEAMRFGPVEIKFWRSNWLCRLE